MEEITVTPKERLMLGRILMNPFSPWIRYNAHETNAMSSLAAKGLAKSVTGKESRRIPNLPGSSTNSWYEVTDKGLPIAIASYKEQIATKAQEEVKPYMMANLQHHLNDLKTRVPEGEEIEKAIHNAWGAFFAALKASGFPVLAKKARA